MAFKGDTRVTVGLPILACLFVCLSACSPGPSGDWQGLQLPEAGLDRVHALSDEHQFVADYVGLTPDELMAAATRALERAGYTKECEALEGRLRGFRRDGFELAIKVDLLGPRLGLMVFDQYSSEELILGVCFGRYTLGPPEIIK